MTFCFYGTIKDDWNLFENCIKSINKVFYPFKRKIIAVDDGSAEEEYKKAEQITNKNKNLILLSNSKNEGIVSSLNKCITNIQITSKETHISIPISSDSIFVNMVYPYLLFWAFRARRADFFFGKTIHKTKDNRITGITGWSGKKGNQCKKTSRTFFLNGMCRPSGWAVAFRTSILKQYYYPDVGCLSDFFLNNLMILKHKSYYTSQKVVATLEREKSFSAMFSKEDNKKNLYKCVDLLKMQGIPINEHEVRQLLLVEKLI